MNRLPTQSALKQLLQKFDVNAAATASRASFKGGKNWVNADFEGATSNLKKLLAADPEGQEAVAQLQDSYGRMRAAYVGDQRDLAQKALPHAKIPSDLSAPKPDFAALKEKMPHIKDELARMEADLAKAHAAIDAEEAAVEAQFADFTSVTPDEYTAKYAKATPSHPLGMDYVNFLSQVNEGYAAAFGKVSENMVEFLENLSQVDAEIKIFEAERAAYQTGAVRTVDEYRYHPEWEDEAEDDAFNDRWLPVNGDKAAYAHSETHEQEHDRDSYFKRDWVVPPSN